MKSHISWAVVIVLIIIIGGVFMLTGQRDKDTGTVVDGAAQKVTLGMKNLNYYPDTIRVKANQPVEITLDKGVTGCFRSFTIPAFGVSKLSKNPSDTIVFTPTNKGNFRFACGMGMGYGTLIVE
ncbi:MAG: cupredoxin domain-containing protein [Nanoarchaeota archaeon]